jgi:hypothetical protein
MLGPIGQEQKRFNSLTGLMGRFSEHQRVLIDITF